MTRHEIFIQYTKIILMVAGLIIFACKAWK